MVEQEGNFKKMLLGNFILKEKVKGFLDYLEKTFDISKCDVFIYKIEDTEKYFVTFRFVIDTDNKTNFKKYFPYSIPIHKKGDAYYTINALNRLIEKDFGVEGGNIDYRSYEVDWSKYQGNIILLENDDLIYHNVCRIF